MPRPSAIGALIDWICTPSQPRTTRPSLMMSSTTSLTTLAGIAKAMPTDPPEGEKIAVFTPTTSPSRLNAGPPELPRLIEASI